MDDCCVTVSKEKDKKERRRGKKKRNDEPLLSWSPVWSSMAWNDESQRKSDLQSRSRIERCLCVRHFAFILPLSRGRELARLAFLRSSRAAQSVHRRVYTANAATKSPSGPERWTSRNSVFPRLFARATSRARRSFLDTTIIAARESSFGKRQLMQIFLFLRYAYKLNLCKSDITLRKCYCQFSIQIIFDRIQVGK